MCFCFLFSSISFSAFSLAFCSISLKLLIKISFALSGNGVSSSSTSAGSSVSSISLALSITEKREMALSILFNTVLLVSVCNAASRTSLSLPIRANKSAACVRCFGVPSVSTLVKYSLTDSSGRIDSVGSAALRTVFNELVANVTKQSANTEYRASSFFNTLINCTCPAADKLPINVCLIKSCCAIKYSLKPGRTNKRFKFS